MSHSSSFVELRGVTAAYEEKASFIARLMGRKPVIHSILRGVSFDLNSGEHITLFGTEGSGKSTLLRLLAGVLAPSGGRIRINNVAPNQIQNLAAGYVSVEESEPHTETAGAILNAFGATHHIPNFPARLGEVSEILHLQSLLYRPAETLSTTERLRINVARAALSQSPIILLDDVVDQFGVELINKLLHSIFKHRTVVIATRHTHLAQALELPLLILHQGKVMHRGTTNELAESISTPRVLDVWVEGVRYDLLRALKQHSGVTDVRLLPNSEFSGQRLRLTVRSPHYLPGVYDVISQAPLVRVEEERVPLHDIVNQLVA